MTDELRSQRRGHVDRRIAGPTVVWDEDALRRLRAPAVTAEQVRNFERALVRMGERLAEQVGPVVRRFVTTLPEPGSVDSLSFDDSPDQCWRCDAVPATTPVGLCTACHADLVDRPWQG